MFKKIALLCFVGMSYLFGYSIEGKVIHISDGDTVHVLTENKEKIKIRLSDIDAPESKQAFGNKSKENLKGYIYQKNVVVEASNQDKYGRTIGTIFLNGQDINLQQVKDGMAWAYRDYSNKAEYFEAESRAKANKLGLWADKEPVRPQDFRKNKNK